MCEILASKLIGSSELQEAIISKIGQPLSGGVVWFYRQQDMTTLKNVYYQSVVGSSPTYIAAPNPLTLGASGSPTDSNGNDTLLLYYPWLDQDFPIELCDPNILDQYYIEVYDSNGNLQFTREYFPFVGEIPIEPIVPGFGSVENYVINNRLWRNFGEQWTYLNGASGHTPFVQYTNQEYNSSGTYYHLTMAPSQHDGFSMPDIQYVRDVNPNSGLTEIISIDTFFTEEPPVIVGDIQPEFFINFNCTADTSGATLKAFQWPITLHQETLAFQPFSFSIQGLSNSGNATVGIYIYQFCGTGQVSPAPRLLGNITFSNTWTKWTLTNLSFPSITQPDVSIGVTGDDAYYLQIGMPTGGSGAAVTNLSFCLPSVYLTTGEENIPTNDFQTYDQIDQIIAAPRTGDVKISMSNFSPFGWVPLSGGTIAYAGTSTSPNNLTASSVGISYQGNDAFALYNLLWTYFKPYDTGSMSNPIAQMYNTSGIATNYDTNAYLDWQNGNQLAVSNLIGQVLMGTVPMPALPIQYSSTFTAAQITTSGATLTGTAGFPPGVLVNSTQPVAYGEVVNFTGTLTNTNLAANTPYYVVPSGTGVFYVASTLANAQAGVYIQVGTSLGSGISVISSSLLLTMTNSPVNAINVYQGQPITFSGTGVMPTGIAAGKVYYAVPTQPLASGYTTICVATSFANAIAGNLIAYSTAGSGNLIITVTLAGTQQGESSHTQYVPEIASHAHGYAGSATTGTFHTTQAGNTPNVLTQPAGNNVPFNVTQPGIYFNMYLKL